jgi:acyl-CoA synthetase (AMP-forming)/AMP-acid ligase II
VTPGGGAVAPGEVGELHVRGPNVMRGYYRKPEATAAAIDVDGWFNTGDLARFEDEILYIIGRTKELIIRSGFNVYPAEVETVLNGLLFGEVGTRPEASPGHRQGRCRSPSPMPGPRRRFPCTRTARGPIPSRCATSNAKSP